MENSKNYFVIALCDPREDAIDVLGERFDNKPFYIKEFSGNIIVDDFNKKFSIDCLRIERRGSRLFFKLRNLKKNKIDPIIKIIRNNLSKEEANIIITDFIKVLGLKINNGILLNKKSIETKPNNSIKVFKFGSFNKIIYPFKRIIEEKDYDPDKYIVPIEYPDYMVFMDGRVCSIKTKHFYKTDGCKGYAKHDFFDKNGIMNKFWWHRFIAAAWLSKLPEQTIVHHKKKCPKNNSILNLEWCTKEEHHTYHRLMRLQDISYIPKQSKSKAIVQMTMDNIVLRIFSSVAKAVTFFNKTEDVPISESVVKTTASRRHDEIVGIYEDKKYLLNSAGGYKWVYLEDIPSVMSLIFQPLCIEEKV